MLLLRLPDVYEQLALVLQRLFSGGAGLDEMRLSGSSALSP